MSSAIAVLLYANSPDCKTKSIVQADVDLCLHVQTEIYKLYGKAYGWYSLLSLCFFWASEQSTNILTSWWLSQWTTAQILYQIEANAGECPLQRLTFAFFFAVSTIFLTVLSQITVRSRFWLYALLCSSSGDHYNGQIL